MVFSKRFLTPSCVLGICEVHCVSVLLWCEEYVHMHACVCVCLPHTCSHRCAVKVLPFLSSAWCLYFILYAVTFVAKTAFLCISFSSSFLAPYLQHRGTSEAPAAHPSLDPCSSSRGHSAPEAVMQFRRPQH